MINTTLKNESFVGNTQVKNFLFSKEPRSISHAVLLYGEKGLGKKTLGRFLGAKLISKEEDYLGSNEGRMVLKDIHPDFLYLKKDGGIKVDDVRQLIFQTNIKPNQADVRVCLLADCDNMNVPAQNALLKTLEEPPEGSRFILTATSKDSLLETIQSRVESFKILPVAVKEGADYLEDRYKVKSKDALEALEVSGGNIGRSLEFLSIIKENKEKEIGKDVVMAMAEGSRYRVTALLSSIRDRKEYSKVLEEILIILSGVMRYKNQGEKSHISNKDFPYQKVAKQLGNKILVQATEEIHQVRKIWDYNPNLQLCSSWLAIKLTNN